MYTTIPLCLRYEEFFHIDQLVDAVDIAALSAVIMVIISGFGRGGGGGRFITYIHIDIHI
jgi:hypothetical protein